MISNDILIVADKPRIQRILDNLEDHWGRSIVSVSSLSEAAEQLADGDNFGLIIIQDRMSGLSHELILRHIRSSLGDRNVMIALATEDMDIHDTEPALHLLDLSLPDRDILKMLERLVSRLPSNDRSSVKEAFALAEEKNNEQLPENHEIIEPADPTEMNDDKPDSPAGYSQEERISGRFEAELETEIARFEETIPADIHSKPEHTLTVSEMMEAAQMQKKKSIIPWITAAALIIIAATYFLKPSPKTHDDKTAVKTVSKQAAASVQKRVTTAARPTSYPLFKFMAKAGAVHDTSFSNPGWERYTTDNLEFRIYREKGNLKAIQVLAVTNENIPSSLFSSALREISNVADYRTSSKASEKGYLVKRGKLGSDGRITIYKTSDDSALRGFVIEPHAGDEKK